MTYRSDLDALEARKAALDVELLEKTRARDEAARMVDEARTLAQAEESLDPEAKRRARRTPMKVTAFVVVAVAIGIAGVARFKSPVTEPDRFKGKLAQMERLTRNMCTCVDAVCARRVSDEMTSWGERESRPRGEPRYLDEAPMRDFVALATRMGECMQRAMWVPFAAKRDSF